MQKGKEKAVLEIGRPVFEEKTMERLLRVVPPLIPEIPTECRVTESYIPGDPLDRPPCNGGNREKQFYYTLTPRIGQG